MSNGGEETLIELKTSPRLALGRIIQAAVRTLVLVMHSGCMSFIFYQAYRQFSNVFHPAYYPSP